MRLALILILTASFYTASAQDTAPLRGRDTFIAFNGTECPRGYGNRSRIVPGESKNPLYVKIAFSDTPVARLEYFRTDSLKYLVYEYYLDRTRNSNDGVKSSGNVTVTNRITDSATSYIDEPDGNQVRVISYFKALVKEGPWLELDDSNFTGAYWMGDYRHNKRTGIWKHLIAGPGGELELERFDYSKAVPVVLHLTNIKRDASLEKMRQVLLGRWSLAGCDEEAEPRAFFLKCALYNGHYGDDCNGRFSRDNVYEFSAPDVFVRQRGDGCRAFREEQLKGNWTVTEVMGERYINLAFPGAPPWKLKILYLDEDRNLITDRE